MRILIVGGGIAGLTLALELERSSHDVTLMERQGRLRSEGYMIDFFGPGFDVAERMGLLPRLAQIHYPIEHLLFFDARGRVSADLSYPLLRREVFRDRHFNFTRGELERLFYEALEGRVDLRFGVSPFAIDLRDNGVAVDASDGTSTFYDLVVGADGVHSRVRSLAFSAAPATLSYLGCHTAAYVASRPMEGLPTDAFASTSGAGFTVGAYPIRGGRTATFFVHRAPEPVHDRSPEACRRELEATYRDQGWRTNDLLAAFPEGGNVYFDDVSQVLLPVWRQGRVVLVGDACGCVSLIAGQGASMAMTAGYILGFELRHAGGYLDAALHRYEARVRPVVERRQRAGRRMAPWFLPATALRAKVRDRVMSFAVRTPAARWLGRSIGASIPLD